MYNLIKIDYSETTESLWFYSKNKAANFNADILVAILVNLSSIRLNTEADENNETLKHATIAVPFKYLSNF